MFLDLLLYGLGGRHRLMGDGGFQKGVWRLLICLIVSFGIGGGRGGMGWRGRLARGYTSRETNYCMSAVTSGVHIASYLACYIFAPVMCMLKRDRAFRQKKVDVVIQRA